MSSELVRPSPLPVSNQALGSHFKGASPHPSLDWQRYSWQKRAAKNSSSKRLSRTRTIVASGGRAVLAREDFRSRFQVVREVDAKGHIHPNELRRKLGREFTGRGLHILGEGGGVQREAMGQAIGLAQGSIRAGASQLVRPAGFIDYVDVGVWSLATFAAFVLFFAPAVGLYIYRQETIALLLLATAVGVVIVLAAIGRSVFRRRSDINVRIDSEVEISIQGEAYEDFRSNRNIPISSNLALLIGGSVRPMKITTSKQDKVLRSGAGKVTMLEGFYNELHFWNAKVVDIVNTIANKAKDTVKELEESFAGTGDVSFRGPTVHAPVTPVDAPTIPPPLDRILPPPPEEVEGVESRSIPAGIRYKVLERDGFACRYCGRRPPEVELEVDHAVAWAAGGDTNIDNLVTSCRDCNRGKSAGSVDPNVTKPNLF